MPLIKGASKYKSNDDIKTYEININWAECDTFETDINTINTFVCPEEISEPSEIYVSNEKSEIMNEVNINAKYPPEPTPDKASNCMIKIGVKNNGKMQQILGICDTGASRSCISLPLFKKYFGNCKVKENKIKIKGLISEQGSSGTTTLTFFIENIQICYHFIIIDIPSFKILLGSEFLRKHKGHVDLETDKLFLNINGKRISTDIIDDRKYLCDRKIQSTFNCTIDPHSEFYIKGTIVDDDETLINQLGVIEPIGGYLKSDNDLAICKTLTYVYQNNSVIVKCLNISNKPIDIEQNEDIAIFSLTTLENAHLISIRNFDNNDETEAQNIIYDFDNINESEIDVHPLIPFTGFCEEMTKKDIIRLKKLLTRFRTVFGAKGDKSLKSIKDYVYSIRFLKHAPSSIKARPYPVNPKKLEILNKKLDELCSSGILTESTVDSSPFSSPMTMLIKANGSSSLLGDKRG